MSESANPELRARLGAARLMLVFGPELCGARDPRPVLEALAGEVDAIQVRPKPAAKAASTRIASDASCEARATYEWTLALLDVLAGGPAAPLVLVNDRVDVALALAPRGCHGLHLGQADLPPREARALVGEELLIGLSTHDPGQVVLAHEEPVDYLGFGPVFASQTKGYTRGLGPEAAWVASEGAALPLFAIGGITPDNAEQLEGVRRVALSSALLGAEDPIAAARAMRAALEG